MKRKKEAIMAAYKQERPKDVNPPRSRLNPKLTQRGAPPGYDDVPPEKHAPKVVPKLAHNGQPVFTFNLVFLFTHVNLHSELFSSFFCIFNVH